MVDESSGDADSADTTMRAATWPGACHLGPLPGQGWCLLTVQPTVLAACTCPCQLLRLVNNAMRM